MDYGIDKSKMRIHETSYWNSSLNTIDSKAFFSDSVNEFSISSFECDIAGKLFLLSIEFLITEVKINKPIKYKCSARFKIMEKKQSIYENRIYKMV